MGHYVYKYVLNGEILYIGKTDRKDVNLRLNQHGHSGDNIPEEGWSEINAAKIYYTELANEVMSDVVESELIRRYRPKYNDKKTHTKWKGLNFPEPIWIDPQLENSQKLHDEIIRLKDVLDSAENKIKELTNENKKLVLENIIANDLVKKYKKHKNDQCHECSNRYKKFQDYFEGLENQQCSNELCFGKTFDEIIEEYKTTTNPLAYKSEAYDRYGNLLCSKSIYTNTYDFLCFDFNQSGTTSKHGCLFVHRDDKTMTNYQAAQQWKNRGNNIYYPYQFQRRTDETK